MEKKKIAVLIGNGGRLKTIVNTCPKNAEIAAVISFKKVSDGIKWAEDQDLQTCYFRLSDYKKFDKTREDLENDLAQYLKALKIDLIVMAGWMLILSNRFLKHFPMKVINVHPALNPSFPGTDGVGDAFKYGAKVTGATVHFVPDDGVDSGPIIMQKAVEIEDKDTAETLADKVHQVEEEILPQAIQLFVDDKLKIEDRRVLRLN